MISGSAHLGAGTTVLGDLRELDSVVTRDAGASVGGTISGLADDVAAFGWILSIVASPIFMGTVVATVLAGLALAGLAARQVRSAERLISTEPLKTFLAGLLAIFVPPVLAILAVVTVVGLPLGIGLLFLVIPTLAFAGYLVAGIWLGERVIDAGRVRQHPYLASIVGLVLLLVLTIIPIVAAVPALFGLGAIVLAGWRTLRSTGPRRTAVMTQVQAAPAGA